MAEARTFPESFKQETGTIFNIDNLYINYIIPFFENHPDLVSFFPGGGNNLFIALNEFPQRKDNCLLIKHKTIDNSSRSVADGYLFDIIYRDKETPTNPVYKIYNDFFKIHATIEDKSSFQIFKLNDPLNDCLTVVFTNTILHPEGFKLGKDEKDRMRDSEGRILYYSTYMLWIDKDSVY